MRLRALGIAATVWPIVVPPDDRWWWFWSNRCNENWQGKPKYSEKTCPSASMSTTNRTWPNLGSKPGRRRGKPATDHLSYGTNMSTCWFIPKVAGPLEWEWFLCGYLLNDDCLCGLVVRVPGYRSRGPEFDFRHYQIFWEVVGLERGPLSLVSIIEELLDWRSSGSGSRKHRLTAVGIHYADHKDTLYPRKLALTSPTSCGRLVGIVRLRTKATEFSLYLFNDTSPTAFIDWESNVMHGGQVGVVPVLRVVCTEWDSS
jgi:hypothetical protein